jgi:hypothetical protein
MARRRTYRRNHPHPESPESRKKSNRIVRPVRAGLLCHTCNIALGHIERRYEMELNRRGGGKALATMCIGSSQGIAAIFTSA